MGKVQVQEDGIYLERSLEILLCHLAAEERELLLFTKVRDVLGLTDWDKPALSFPMSMEQFELFTSLVGLAENIDQQRLADFIAEREDMEKFIERHAQAMAGKTLELEDRIYQGLLIPTVDDRDLDEIITAVSEIFGEIEKTGAGSADGGGALCSSALHLLERLRDISFSRSKNDLEKAVAHLEDAAVQLVYRIFERETEKFPSANDKLKERVGIFMSGRHEGARDALGERIMVILREHIEAQQGNNRKFPEWRQVARTLQRESVLSGNPDSPIYEVQWQDGNRNDNDGTIELLRKGKKVTFQNLRERLTGYRKALKNEYKGKNILLS